MKQTIAMSLFVAATLLSLTACSGKKGESAQPTANATAAAPSPAATGAKPSPEEVELLRQAQARQLASMPPEAIAKIRAERAARRADFMKRSEDRRAAGVAGQPTRPAHMSNAQQ